MLLEIFWEPSSDNSGFPKHNAFYIPQGDYSVKKFPSTRLKMCRKMRPFYFKFKTHTGRM